MIDVSKIVEVTTVRHSENGAALRWPNHIVRLDNGNEVFLRWNESESANTHPWEPRGVKPGDHLLVDEDGLKMAIYTDPRFWLNRHDKNLPFSCA